jgi:hypothetical protein
VDEPTSTTEGGSRGGRLDDSPPADSPEAAPNLTDPTMPNYKGAPLEADRGPGLGCFWSQVVLLVALLILTPLSVVFSAPSWLSAAMLILVLVLLFFVGQTMIFLLRLVAADRRTRRRPLAPSARRTVGQLEEVSAARATPEDNPSSEQNATARDPSNEDNATAGESSPGS